jgi:pimeloyl-ACP methyl ester carboxylesterase
MEILCRVRPALLAIVAVLALAPAGAHAAKPPPALSWQACADGFQCATAKVPRDYDSPNGPKLEIPVTRLRAQGDRVGALFVNFGGPGADAVATLHAIGKDLLGALNERFDLVGFDPRGSGESSDAIDCHADQEFEGVYSKPFMTPELDERAYLNRVRGYVGKCLANNRGVFPYVATANVARDMDFLRRAIGESRLNYLGFSYGTFLGATYASLFPHRYRAMVLDGPLDPDQYINRPEAGLRAQTAAFERALGRFFQACAAHQDACLNFGGDDPHDAYDRLVERLDAAPLPAGAGDPRTVNGDDLNFAIVPFLYAKQSWPFLAELLATTEAGDGSFLRFLADVFWGNNGDGTFDPSTDRYFTLSAAEQRYTDDVAHYFEAGADSWATFDHLWSNTGYVELNWGLFPVRARDAFYGPFRAASDDPTVLVVDTTYDPATPYRGGRRLASQLGNARLLTMRGDGHTAYPFNSSCIDQKVEAYFVGLALPPAGASCAQEVPFSAAATATATAVAGGSAKQRRKFAAALRRMGRGVTPAVSGIGR